MSLTDTVLKALKPQDASYIVSDDHGLYVEVLASGSIVWRYRYRLNGKCEKLTLSKYPALIHGLRSVTYINALAGRFIRSKSSGRWKI